MNTLSTWRPLKGHMLSEQSQPEPWAVNQVPSDLQDGEQIGEG
jgi:hypothetical protein